MGYAIAGEAARRGAEVILVSGPTTRHEPAGVRRSLVETALEMLGAPAAETWMIGDDIQGDVGGAQDAGLKAILVKTGKFRPADLSSGIRPDQVLDSIADLPHLEL